MDLRDGLREQKIDSSPSASSDSSWTSFEHSTDLTSISSDQVLTPLTAPSCCKLFEDQDQDLKKNPSSAKVSSGVQTREVTWRETSFLGDDE